MLPLLAELGLIPVDAEFVREGSENFLRIYIDKEGGVTINDCEEVSRRIDPMLDEEDFIGDPYILEVSSPGLGRKLRRPHDFEYAQGREIEVRTYRAIGGKKSFTGILTAFDDKTVTMRVGEEEMLITRSEISLIRLALDFD